MNETKNNSRRKFLQDTLVLSGLASIAPQLLNAQSYHKDDGTKTGEAVTFLFQGDSITDGNRTRNNDWNHVMGHGYQYIIASKLWYDFPSKGLHFFNRGISGNKVPDLASRWQKDTIDIKPDVLSILIGINDASTFINGDSNLSAEVFESGYRALLQQTKQQLPNIQLILCEPFILNVGKLQTKYDVYLAEMKKRQQIVKQLSNEFNTIFVGFQDAFNKALSRAPAEYWIWDGVHPMPAGHELMAREWLHAVGKKVKFIKH
jgi:lysophospholipase L1-like esterase